MTPPHNEVSVASPVTAATAAGSATQDVGEMQPGRAELETFIASTRRELQTLSLTLAQTLNEDVAPAAQPASAAQPTGSADPPHAPAAEQARKHEAGCPLPAETVVPECDTLPTNGGPMASDAVPDSGTDPLARLNAIKLRLAQQIQNAS